MRLARFSLFLLASVVAACGGSDVPPTDPTDVPVQNPPTREEELQQAPSAMPTPPDVDQVKGRIEPTPAAPAPVAPAPTAAGEKAEEKRDLAREVRNDRRDKIVEQTTNWHKLGERWVEGAADRDVIAVGKSEGRFKQILFGVEHSGLVLFDVIVTFGDGEKFAPVTRLVFDEGTATRVLDLPGKTRVIKNVEFRYGNLPGGGKAQVELWAR